MSYIDSTALVKYQNKVLQNEIDIPEHGALKFLEDQTPQYRWLDDELKQKIMKANGRSISQIAQNELSPTVTTSFSFDIPLSLGTTAEQAITIYQFWTGFTYYPHDFSNNAARMEDYVANKYEECDKVLAASKASQILTVLNARKTQALDVTGAPTGILFNASDYITIASALQDDPFFSYLSAIMKQNSQIGTYSMLSSISLEHTLANHKLYGKANEKNLLSQNFPKFYVEDEQDVTSGSNFTGYFVKNGCIAEAESIPSEFTSGENIGNVSRWGVGDMKLPISRQRPLIFEKEVEADTRNLTSSDRPTSAMTKGIKVGVGISFALLYNYNSAIATRVNDIAKVEGLST